jgi:glutamine synthetase
VDFTVGAELEFCLCDGSTDYPVDCSNFADTVLLNRQEEFISTVYEHLQQQDVEVELLHAESAHGQMELVLRYRTDPVQAADDVILARETVRAVANGKGLKALFLPKVAPAAAGNGFHVHLSMQDVGTGRNVFTDLNSGNGISARGQSFMEGMLRHMPAITAFTLPTVNSYRRVGPGCWTGSTPSWAYDDKESGLRVVSSSSSSSTGGAPIIMERVEFKLCDSTANLYLALAALLSAGLEGMKQQWGLRPANDTTGRVIPTSLAESLNNLESSEFFQRAIPKRLLKGYLALRRAEAERASSMSLEDEVKEALQKA